MPEQVRVRYTKRLTQKIGDNFDTSELGGEWEFSIPDGGDIQSAFDNGYVVLRRIVEDRFEGENGYVMPPRTLPGENIRAAQPDSSAARGIARIPYVASEDMPESEEKDEQTYHTFPPRATMENVVVGQPVFLERGRVWEVNDRQDARGKRYVTVRIGNRDRFPTGYARIKASEPSEEMMDKLAALQESDFVDVWGHYESWPGKDNVLQWDFIPNRVERRK